MQSKILTRFPELGASSFEQSEDMEVATIVRSTSNFVAAKVTDFKAWQVHDVSLESMGEELYGSCTCDAYADGKRTECAHICELLEYMQWSSFPWPAHTMRLLREDRLPTWKRVFAQVGHVIRRQQASHSTSRIHYIIDVPRTMDRSRLCIVAMHSKRGQRGGWLKPRPKAIASLRQLPLSNAQSEAVEAIYSCTSSESQSADGLVEVVDSMQLSILRRLAETSELHWTLDDPGVIDAWKPLQWREGQWDLRIVVEPDDDGWRFDAQICLGEDVRNISEPVLFLNSGAVLFESEICLYRRSPSAFPWVAAMRDTGPFVVPSEDTAEMLQELYATHGSSLMFEVPDELKYETSVGVPSPRAQIRKPERGNRALRVDVTFMYEGHAARRQVGAIDHEQKRIITRDSDAETAHLETLLAAGVHQRERYELPSNQLPAAVAFLTAAGWHVEADGKLIRSSRGIHIAVQTGLDWFDLDGTFDFDGAQASIPKVLSAMRRGDKFVQLDDGSHGLLPEEWLRKYAPIAHLGEADGDSLRFTLPQAALLDAMLNAQDDVQLDAKYKRFRERLQSFDGIQPAKPHRNFKGTLRAYQQDGLGWMKFLREFGLGGCLADDMGLGKTIQVLAMLQSERARRPKKGERRLPSLIVVPRSLLFNWKQEASRFTPNLKVMQYFGLQRQDLHEDWHDQDIIITTYGIVRRDIEFLVEQSFHYVVLDEAQAIKNNTSQAAKACRLLDARHRLALTGTPVENHLGELWSLFEFLNPGLLGRNSAFLSLARRAVDDEEARTTIARGIRPFVLRRTKENVLKDLPKKTEQTVFCEMEPSQRAVYDELRDYYRKLLGDKVASQGLKRSKIHVLEALLRLRQCACHPRLLDQDSELPSAKLDTMLEHIESIVEEGHKALVFSQFTKLLSLVRTELDQREITYEYLDGRTRKRQERVEAFQNTPECSLFLISLKAGGHGLNLTKADYVFILDPWWNPAVEAQAVDRAHRIGQQKPVFAYRMICKDTVEEKILQLQAEKRNLAESIINADSSVMRDLTADDLAVLLS